jgi:hypothetical protein
METIEGMVVGNVDNDQRVFEEAKVLKAKGQSATAESATEND